MLEIYKRFGVLIVPEDIAVIFRPKTANHVLIRIQSEFFKPLRHPDLYDDILEVLFDDHFDGVTLTEQQAKVMVEFMRKNVGKNLVVHCQAGVSRSAATACAWAYLSGDAACEGAIRYTQHFTPNPLVYRMLVEEIDASGMEGMPLPKKASAF